MAGEFVRDRACQHCGGHYDPTTRHTCTRFCAGCAQPIHGVAVIYSDGLFHNWNCVAAEYRPIGGANGMTSTIDGGRAVWQWEFSAQGEKDIGAVGSTLRQYAQAGLLWMKAMDGAVWQARYDTGAHAIDSLATWQATVTQGAQAGIDVRPWVVVQNRAQAAVHAQLGRCVMVDLEDDPANYWHDSIGNIPGYFADLRAAGVEEIHVAIDPRPYHTNFLLVQNWARLVDGIHSQSYWPAFQTPALANVADVVALLRLNPNTYPILPFDATAADLVAFWAACKAAGCKAASLWRLGSANALQLQAFGSLDVGTADPCADLRQQVTDLTATNADLNALVARQHAALTQIQDAAQAALV